jgi:hypothetical protein
VRGGGPCRASAGGDPAHQAEDWAYRRQVFGITERSVVNVMSLGCWAGAGHNYPIATWHAGGTVAMHQQSNIWNGLRVPGVTHCFVFPQLLFEILQARRTRSCETTRCSLS